MRTNATTPSKSLKDCVRYAFARQPDVIKHSTQCFDSQPLHARMVRGSHGYVWLLSAKQWDSPEVDTFALGTGSISILFLNSPYARDSTAIQVLTHVFFFLNLALFIIFNIITAARYIIFPDIWSTMMNHPIQSLYTGTYPMGGATLISVAVGQIYQRDGFGGIGFLYAMWGFWWLDVAISLACAFEVVHIM